jgi:hypothetical protein
MDGGKAWFARRRLRPPGDQLLRFGGGDRFEAKRGGDAGPVWQEKKEASGEEDFFSRVIWNQAITIFRSWRNATTIRVF